MSRHFNAELNSGSSSGDDQAKHCALPWRVNVNTLNVFIYITYNINIQQYNTQVVLHEIKLRFIKQLLLLHADKAVLLHSYNQAYAGVC